MASIEEKVETLLKEKIEQLGYDLYDVQYAKEGKDYFLRIFIDKPEGIDLNDCETVSRGIDEILDSADYIKEQYFLEVSSAGVERVLRKDKHLKDNLEKEVEIKLFKPIDGKKEYSGILKSFDSSEIVIVNSDNQIELKLDRKNISLIKIKFNW